MKTTELRINNWVRLKDSDPIENYQVTQILERGINSGRVGMLYDMVEPIPLTKEWLVRFGFEYGFDGNLTKGQLTIEKHLNGGWLRILDGTWSDGIKIEHVHQLQNLYFALTGEELELKP